MKQKVLITGANGFIGQHLVKKALEIGLEVHAAIRSSSHLGDLKELIYNGSVFGVNLNYSNVQELEQVLKGQQYDYIIHAAGATRASSQEGYNRINAEFAYNLALAAKEAGVKRFVFVSSLAALGPIGYQDNQPIQDDSPYRPVTMYGKSKALAESMILKIESLPLTIIRPTAVYGPGEKDIFILFKTLSQRLDPYIGTEPQRFSFVYVSDLVDAILLACKSTGATKAYNISDGKVYDRYALANAYKAWSRKSAFRVHVPVGIIGFSAKIMEGVGKLTKNTPVLNQDKLNELTAENWNCEISNARKELGYNPQVFLAEGVRQSLTWYVQKGWLSANSRSV